jgi:hypothetical protein
MEALIRLGSLDSRSKGRFLLAFAFFFFVVSSAPHRVHHFFQESLPAQPNTVSCLDCDNSAHKAGHGHNGPKAPGTNPADCAVLSLAQNAHPFTPPLVALIFQAIAYARVGDLNVFSTASFNPSPFSQRAPPRA